MRHRYINFSIACEHYLINLSFFFRYVFFAIIATVANLATQRAVLHLVVFNASLSLAIGAGTVIGLVTKYILDKRLIFYDSDNSLRGNTVKFARYTFTGIFTTAIFWLTEVLFWLLWKSHFMREVGAIIGLSLGYFIKYRLDQKHVFSTSYSDKRS